MFAVPLTAEWMAWVCPHVHATAHEAKSCREKDGHVPTKVPEGLTLEEVQDFLSIPYESDLEEGEVEVWRCSEVPGVAVSLSRAREPRELSPIRGTPL